MLQTVCNLSACITLFFPVSMAFSNRNMGFWKIRWQYEKSRLFWGNLSQKLQQSCEPENYVGRFFFFNNISNKKMPQPSWQNQIFLGSQFLLIKCNKTTIWSKKHDFEILIIKYIQFFLRNIFLGHTKISQLMMIPKAITQKLNTNAQYTYTSINNYNTFYQQVHLEIKGRKSVHCTK